MEAVLGAPRKTPFPLGDHLLDLLALEVFLRTAQVARDDREPLYLRITR